MMLLFYVVRILEEYCFFCIGSFIKKVVDVLYTKQYGLIFESWGGEWEPDSIFYSKKQIAFL